MAEQPRTGLAMLANRLMRKAGFQVVRTPTIERLLAGDADRAQDRDMVRAMQTRLAEQDRRLAALESRPDEQALRNVIRYAMKAHWRTVDLIEQVSGTDRAQVCPLCGHAAGEQGFEQRLSECIFLGGRLVRHVCPACDAIFGPQKMFNVDQEMLDLDYRNLYRVYAEGDSTESTIRTFHLLAPTRQGTYLDFGCGGEWTQAIRILREQGWNIFGFEPSASQSSEFVFSRWEELQGRQFDGILSHNVIEHLFDPVDTTRRLGQLLTPGGRVVHASPCFDYRYEFTHYHVFFLPGRSPGVMAARAGMRVVDFVRDGEFIACVLTPDPPA